MKRVLIEELHQLSSQGWVVRWLMIGLLFGVGLIWGIVGNLPDRDLHLVVCDVGQGDAVLIHQGSMQVLVDGGPNSSVLDCLSRHLPFWDRTLEVVVLTHPQADHLNGLVDVLERYDVEQVVVNGLVNDTAGFRAFQEVVIDEGALVYLPSRGDEIRLGPIRLTVLLPEEKLGLARVWEEPGVTGEVLGIATHQGDLNETSVVLKLTFGEFDALLVGDIGFSSEQALIVDGVLSEVEVLKVGHHGSKYASSLDFLREIRPTLAVISVGGKNSYGHPTRDTLMRLDTVGARVFRTDVEGDVEIVSNGQEYWVID